MNVRKSTGPECAEWDNPHRVEGPKGKVCQKKSPRGIVERAVWRRARLASTAVREPRSASSATRGDRRRSHRAQRDITHRRGCNCQPPVPAGDDPVRRRGRFLSPMFLPGPVLKRDGGTAAARPPSVAMANRADSPPLTNPDSRVDLRKMQDLPGLDLVGIG